MNKSKTEIFLTLSVRGLSKDEADLLRRSLREWGEIDAFMYQNQRLIAEMQLNGYKRPKRFCWAVRAELQRNVCVTADLTIMEGMSMGTKEHNLVFEEEF